VSGHELIVVRRGRFSYVTFGSARGGLVFEVGVGDFLVVFCGGGWTWRIVWQWYLMFSDRWHR
jgi:uncharacterized protein YjlB